MERFKLIELFKFLIKIGNLFFINKFAYKRSKWICVLMNIVILFYFLVSRFIQLQLVPISLSFILNGYLASYNGMICSNYSELFKRLGSEFNVQYDRPKHWKVSELRELVNEVYSLYSALYLSVNVYNSKLGPELSNLYNSLRKLLILLSNELVRPKGIDIDNLVHIDIYNDFNNVKDPNAKDVSVEKLTRELPSEIYINFLSLVHSENSKLVNDQHVMQVLIEFPDLTFFEQIVSHSNNLFNICNVLSLEGMKEHSRGFISHFFSHPNYAFGNLTFLRSLLIYKFKAVHNRIVANKLTGEVIDTLFIPHSNFLNSLQREKINSKLIPRSSNTDTISLLFGSDIYCKVMDGYRGVKNVLVYAGPNAACYEFHAFQSEIPTLVEAGNSIILFNYTSVANSIGLPKITNITRNNSFLINHILNHYNISDGNGNNNNLSSDRNTNVASLSDSAEDGMKINYYGFSLGGFFTLKMCKGSEMRFMVFNKTFGDMRNLSMSMVGKFVGPLLPLFNLSSNTIDEFYRLKTNKIITVDINDEIIPIKCSLPNELIKRLLLPGINKLTKSFIDYKFKTLQIINNSINSTNPHNSSNSNNSINSDNVNSSENVMEKLMCTKDILNVLMYNINSIGESLLNLLESGSENNLKDEISSTNEFFTKLLVYGSIPNNCVSGYANILKRKKFEPYSLCNLYNILSQLQLNTNYFSTCSKLSESNTMRYNMTESQEKYNSGEYDRKDSDKRESRLIKVPVKVAVYFSVLLEGNTIVISKDNDYYLDFSSVTENTCEASHVYKFLKNDLKNFGIPKIHLTPIKLLAYFRLYSIVNVFYTMNKVKNIVDQFEEVEDINSLYELVKIFLYNFVQLLIEEPFGELTTVEETAGSVSYEFQLNKLRNEYQKFGVVIPEFVGHNEQNPHTLSLIKDLIKNL
ncbi:uncharacterized protein TA04225 [Theileria annulata]|uniref:Uncharacterized protein n=1 Tax=Theileria annulata TaxID=5874 RepID=Q4UC62_THEAN|nr:uncharacterized protein TA04225 [Theileria annulata]CAI75589.1 hypothetical protein TA04225 [Theileria annulata]|eukprot:XP_955065.1 hypothetical protein TA04225 [Theileria annulata]